MARVVINTQNYMFATMMKRTLENGGDFNVTIVNKTENIINEFNRVAAEIVLLEVTAHEPWTYEKRVALGQYIKKVDMDCKVIFLVDENIEPRVAEKVLQGKKDGLIDAFIYNSISDSYLLAIMETI